MEQKQIINCFYFPNAVKSIEMGNLHIKSRSTKISITNYIARNQAFEIDFFCNNKKHVRRGWHKRGLLSIYQD